MILQHMIKILKSNKQFYTLVITKKWQFGNENFVTITKWQFGNDNLVTTKKGQFVNDNLLMT